MFSVSLLRQTSALTYILSHCLLDGEVLILSGVVLCWRQLKSPDFAVRLSAVFRLV